MFLSLSLCSCSVLKTWDSDGGAPVAHGPAGTTVRIHRGDGVDGTWDSDGGDPVAHGPTGTTVRIHSSRGVKNGGG